MHTASGLLIRFPEHTEAVKGMFKPAIIYLIEYYLHKDADLENNLRHKIVLPLHLLLGTSCWLCSPKVSSYPSNKVLKGPWSQPRIRNSEAAAEEQCRTLAGSHQLPHTTEGTDGVIHNSVRGNYGFTWLKESSQDINFSSKTSSYVVCTPPTTRSSVVMEKESPS